LSGGIKLFAYSLRDSLIVTMGFYVALGAMFVIVLIVGIAAYSAHLEINRN
jgi:hypothetical protein